MVFKQKKLTISKGGYAKMLKWLPIGRQDTIYLLTCSAMLWRNYLSIWWLLHKYSNLNIYIFFSTWWGTHDKFETSRFQLVSTMTKFSYVWCWSTVLFHRYPENTPSIQAVYITCSTPFDEVEVFIDQMVKRWVYSWN